MEKKRYPYFDFSLTVEEQFKLKAVECLVKDCTKEQLEEQVKQLHQRIILLDKHLRKMYRDNYL